MVKEITLMTNARFYLDFYRWRKAASYQKPIYIEDNGITTPEKRCGAIRDLKLAIDSRQGEDEDYLVLCSDNFFDFPLSHFLLPVLSHPHFGFLGLYDVKEREEASKYGVVQIDESHHRIIDFEEKPAEPKSTLVSVGTYYLPGALRYRLDEYLGAGLPADKIGDFIGYLSAKENLYGVEFEGAWFDIGSLESYEKARRHLNANPL
jgi:glucose-1-phosphate thymidylyltransferase